MEPEKIDSGGGSGGSPVVADEISTVPPDPASTTDSIDGDYSIAANSVSLLARPPIPPATPNDPVISLVATGLPLDPTAGRVDIRGGQGVRVTAGLPLLPPTTSKSTNGVEIIVGETQNITIQRGLLTGVDQLITIEPGAMMVDGGAGTITIQSLTEIKLSVMGGLSSITLTPMGIIIQGPLVMIN